MSALVKYQVVVFFAVTLALSGLIAFIVNATDSGGLGIFIVLTPSLTAIALTAIIGGWQGVKELTVGHVMRPFGWRWLLLSVLLFPAAAVLLQAAFLDDPFAVLHSDLLPYVIIIFVIAIGEEFGWRAYAMPRLLKRYSVLVSGGLVGIVWAAWHYPGALIGQGSPENIPFLLFALLVIGAGILMGWVYANTRSAITAILMHASMNAAFIYSPLLPDKAGVWPFVALVALVWLAVAALIFVAKIGAASSVPD